VRLGVHRPIEVPGRHVYYVYPFTVPKGTRKRFVKRMKAHGVNVGAGYITPPLHHYPAFRKYAKRELPVVDELSFHTLCLLDCVRPPATARDMHYVAEAMKESLR
jgi:dTDP-4-amino-4,6-dideoxygalactose transaminase